MEGEADDDQSLPDSYYDGTEVGTRFLWEEGEALRGRSRWVQSVLVGCC